MANVKHQIPNPRGVINVVIGRQLVEELREVARREERTLSGQVAIILREWLERRKNLLVNGKK